jgi:hypothetical protein
MVRTLQIRDFFQQLSDERSAHATRLCVAALHDAGAHEIKYLPIAYDSDLPIFAEL